MSHSTITQAILLAFTRSFIQLRTWTGTSTLTVLSLMCRVISKGQHDSHNQRGAPRIRSKDKCPT